MTFLGGKWQCLECGYQSQRNHVRNHVESKHLPPEQGYQCLHCFKNLRTKIALRDHLRTNHRFESENC